MSGYAVLTQATAMREQPIACQNGRAKAAHDDALRNFGLADQLERERCCGKFPNSATVPTDAALQLVV